MRSLFPESFMSVITLDLAWTEVFLLSKDCIHWQYISCRLIGLLLIHSFTFFRIRLISILCSRRVIDYDDEDCHHNGLVYRLCRSFLVLLLVLHSFYFDCRRAGNEQRRVLAIWWREKRLWWKRLLRRGMIQQSSYSAIPPEASRLKLFLCVGWFCSLIEEERPTDLFSSVAVSHSRYAKHEIPALSWLRRGSYVDWGEAKLIRTLILCSRHLPFCIINICTPTIPTILITFTIKYRVLTYSNFSNE